MPLHGAQANCAYASGVISADDRSPLNILLLRSGVKRLLLETAASVASRVADDYGKRWQTQRCLRSG